MMIGIAIAVALIIGYLILIEPRRCSEKQELTFCGINYAHRGLHTEDRTVPENSMAAFAAAAEAGYGIELDVRLSKDGQVVVFHDRGLDRICGVSLRVEETTYEELREYGLCGTEEKISLLQDVLDLVGGRVPIIIELKEGSRNRLLCEKTASILDGYGGAACIQSFNPFIVGWFNRKRPNIFRGQLTAQYGALKDKTLRFNAFMASRILGNLWARPHFISHRKGKKAFSVMLCQWLGAKKFVWTVRGEEEAERYEATEDGIIFEFYRPAGRFME